MTLLDQTIYPVPSQYVRVVYGHGLSQEDPGGLGHLQTNKAYYWRHREEILAKMRGNWPKKTQEAIDRKNAARRAKYQEKRRLTAY